MSKNPYIGSTLDELLQEDDVLKEATAIAQKRLLSWQLQRAMEERKLTKTAMAQAMKTSRASLDRLLDPNDPSVTLRTMDRAANVLGLKLKIELIEPDRDKF